MSEVIISVDLGGTRIRAARLDEKLVVQAREETLTRAHEGQHATIQRIKDQIRLVLPDDGSSVRGIGVSVPGPTNPKTGVVVHGTNLGWTDVPLAQILRDEFDCPCFLGNDANVAALAEATVGAAQGCRNVIFITVSTGIGGGVINDGRLLLGRNGLAAEAGHLVMVVGDRVSTMEKEAAGPALARHAREKLAAGRESVMRDMVDGDIDEVDGKVIDAAAEQHDPLAMEIIEEAGRVIGCGMASLLHLFDPEIIVIGGGVALGMEEMLLVPMRETIYEQIITPAYGEDLQIVPPKLGEDVSLIGAGALVITQGGVDDISTVIEQLKPR